MPTDDKMRAMTEPDQRYQARGVSAGKTEVHAAIAEQDQGLFPGSFCKIVPDYLSADDEHCLVVHADGAGTKSSLAYLAWMEGLGQKVWAGIAQDSLVMNLDDCGCVGALGPYLISNTIGRNAKRIPGDVIKGIIDGYQQVCDTLADEGIRCIMTGGETADVGDLVRTVIADSTVVARLHRDHVIDASRMEAGDVIISLSSTGQARWESSPNAGMGSNGLTSARHDALGADYAARYPETYAPEVAREYIYCGHNTLNDPLPGDDRFTVGSALLSPTRTYLPFIKALSDTISRQDLHALIHCSGGGQTKIGKFGHGLHYKKYNPLPVAPLFTFLQSVSGTTWREAYTVWNMGARLDLVVPPQQAEACLAVASDCAIEAQVSGIVEAAPNDRNLVTIEGEGGSHHYHM